MSKNLSRELSNRLEKVGLPSFDEGNDYEMSNSEIEKLEDHDGLSEVKIKKVVRAGKIVKKLDCREGYKAEDGKCVRITAQEARRRSIGAKKAAKKRKGKQGQINRKRSISQRKRNTSGL